MTMNKLDNQIRKISNLIEATAVSKNIRKFVGLNVITQEVNEMGRVKAKFSVLGFICFMLWCSLYSYSCYISLIQDQSILRRFYNTKLKYYGDGADLAITTLYVILVMWQISIVISGDPEYTQIIFDVDDAIRKLNYDMDYSKCRKVAILMVTVQLIIVPIHMLSLWITQSTKTISAKMPYALTFVIVFANALGIASTTFFCFYLYIVRERYNKLNDIIGVVLLTSYTGSNRSIQLQDRDVCETLRSAAKIFAMLHKAVGEINKMFWLTIMACMGKGLLSIILNMFYLMEVTAAQMFLDELERYIYFLIYICWDILYSTFVIFLSIHSCVNTKYVASTTAHLTHEVINANLSPAVTQVAMQLSHQLLHQSPDVSLSGVYQLNYIMLIQGARIVATFEVMLLQYARSTW